MLFPGVLQKHSTILAFWLFILSTGCSAKLNISDKEYAELPQIFRIDDYDHCVLYEDRFEYCWVTIQLSPTDVANPSKSWRNIEEINSDSTNYRHDLLRYGICIPETLNNSTNLHDVYRIYDHNNRMASMGLLAEVTESHCWTSQRPAIGFAELLFAISIAIYLIAVAASTVCDILFTKWRSLNIISTFSIRQNWNRLAYESHRENPLQVMQGIRFYNLICIIFGHVLATTAALPIENTHYIEAVPDRVVFRFVADGATPLVVQTSFLLSSWLLMYRILIDAENDGITWKYIVRSMIDRYIRLTPGMLIVILFQSTWFAQLEDGPMWHVLNEKEYSFCKQFWWRNLFYINNLGSFSQNMCCHHTWFLSADMQYHLVALVVFKLFYKDGKKCLAFLGGLLLFYNCASFWTFYTKQLSPAYKPYPEMNYGTKMLYNKDIQLAYYSFIMNLPGNIAGLICGVFFYRMTRKSLTWAKWNSFLWWVLTWGVILVIVSLPGWMSTLTPGYEENRFVYDAIFSSVSKTLFSLSIGFWILGATQGKGGFVKEFLEWGPVDKLARLSYSVYLLHPVVLRIRFGWKRHNHSSDYAAFSDTMEVIATSFLFGLLFTLIFEYPFAHLQHLYIKKRKRTAEANKNK